MKIAIVDDQENERGEMQRLLFEYFSVNKLKYKVDPVFTEYKSGEEFLNSYQENEYQIVLLDIYMNKLTGIDVAAKISMIDKNCNIILFTSSADHILDGYDVRALGYVLKPVSEHKKSLYKALDHAMDNLKMDNSMIDIQTKHGKNKIFCQKIVYLESAVRSLYLHLTKEAILLNGKYDYYKEQLLSDKRFLECYRNIIVNMDYIDSQQGLDFLLKTGEKIPISRRRKNTVMERYTSYFLEGRFG